jgi:uncharacterized ion transporter superfamily protein YfcC
VEEKKMKETSKKFKVPHSLAIIVVVMLVAAVLTYIIPSGVFDRVKDEAGRTVVVPGSYHAVEKTPVNPLRILEYVFPGLQSAGQIIFALLCAGGGLGIVLATGMFQGGSLHAEQEGKRKGMAGCSDADDRLRPALHSDQPQLFYSVCASWHNCCHGYGI